MKIAAQIRGFLRNRSRRRLATWLLGAVALVVAVQDFSGALIGRKMELRTISPAPSHPKLVRLRAAMDAPPDRQVLRQVRVRENGSRLRGPYNFVSQLYGTGPGTFVMMENTVMVQPRAAGARYQAWIPAPVPSWLRWPLYAGALFVVLLPRTRRYFGAHPAPGGRLPYLDAVRGLACLLVVTTHFTGIFYPTLGSTSAQSAGAAWFEPDSLYRVLPFVGLVNAAEFGVDVFFILSGFVLYLPFCGGPRDLAGLGGAAAKRPLRLYGLVIAVMILIYLLHLGGWYFGSYFNPPKTWAGFAGDLANAWHSSLEYNGAFWTIQYELIGSWAVFLFAAVAGGSWLRWLCYPAAMVLTRQSGYVDFAIGAMMADVWKSFPGVVRSPRWNFAAPLVLALGLLLGGHSSDIGAPAGINAWLHRVLPDARLVAGGGYGVIGATLVIAGVLLWPGAQRALGHHALRFMGRISFAVYAIHGPVLCSFACWVYVRLRPSALGAKYSFMPDGAAHHAAAALALVLSLFLIITTAAALTAFVDEPCIRLAKRLGDAVRAKLRAALQRPALAGTDEGRQAPQRGWADAPARDRAGADAAD